MLRAPESSRIFRAARMLAARRIRFPNTERSGGGLRYQKFLIGRTWTTEYSSTEDPTQFPYIHKYSPYQHVVAGTKYPAILFFTGDGDTRVDPMNARKMTQEASNPDDRCCCITRSKAATAPESRRPSWSKTMPKRWRSHGRKPSRKGTKWRLCTPTQAPPKWKD
jgi:Prolyl oligopeptidase family